MEREKQLRFCKVCKNQKFDIKQGIICDLTGQRATFDLECDQFEEDAKLKEEHIAKDFQNALTSKISSQGTRFANYILDLIFLFVLSFVGAFILAFILAIFARQVFTSFDWESKVFSYLFGFIISFLYYTIMEYASGRSIAKYITKTKVVTENGESPGFQAILIRSLCRFIPFEALSFLGGEESGWHDRISGTRVINIK